MNSPLTQLRRTWFFGALLLALATGCGSDGMQPVTGTVTFDGKPVEDGRITFRTVGGDGKTFSAPVTNGAFSLRCGSGPMAVEVTASRIIPGKFDNTNGTPEPVGEMYIPARYNSQTKLKAEISSSNRKLTFDLLSRG